MKKSFVYTISFAIALVSSSPVFAAPVELRVPFTPQMPDGLTGEPWENACEETSVAMVHAYYENKTLPTQVAKNEIKRIVGIRKGLQGVTYDESAEEIHTVIESLGPSASWEARLVDRPSITDIKGEIDAGHPVIIPFDASDVVNPYFRPGPKLGYHMAVIIGYDDETQQFIMNDPGTRNGHRFRYTYDDLMDANASFLVRDIPQLRGHEAIFTKPKIECPLSLFTVYADTTTKEEYLITARCTKQNIDASVGASYTQASEIQSVESDVLATIPFDDEKTVVNEGPLYTPQKGSILKAKNSSRVFLLSDQLQYFATEEVFKKLGYKSEWIEEVDPQVFTQFFYGPDITNSSAPLLNTVVKLSPASTTLYRVDSMVSGTTKILLRPITTKEATKQIGMRQDRIVELPQTIGYEIGPNINFIFSLPLDRESYGNKKMKDVVYLQRRLFLGGYLEIPYATGYFDEATEKAVMKYQEANGLDPVGVLGPRTRTLLNSTQ